MGTPISQLDFRNLDDPLPVAGQKTKISDLDFTNLDDPPEPPSGMRRFANRVQNMNMLANLMHGVVQPEAAANFLTSMANSSGRGTAVIGALKDFGDFVLHKSIPTVIGAMKIAGGDPTAVAKFQGTIGAGLAKQASESSGNPLNMAAGMALAIASPITDIIDFTTGVNQETGAGNFQPLTVEEQKEKVKNVVSMAAAMGTVGVLSAPGRLLSMEGSALVDEGGALTKFAKSADTPKLYSMAKADVEQAATGVGKLAKTVRANSLAKGSVFGLTQAGVAGMGGNPDDQLTSMFINGVLFAPLGLAHEMITGGVTEGAQGLQDRLRTRAGTAHEIASLRQVRALQENTVGGVLSMVDGLKGAESIFDAVIKGNLGKEEAPLFVATVPKEELVARREEIQNHLANSIGEEIDNIPDTPAAMKRAVERNGHNITFKEDPTNKGFLTVHRDGDLDMLVSDEIDGVHKVLVTTSSIANAIDRSFFNKTGFIKNGFVAHEGKEYVLKAGSEIDRTALRILRDNKNREWNYANNKGDVETVNRLKRELAALEQQQDFADDNVGNKLARLIDPMSLTEKIVPFSELRPIETVKGEFVIQRVYHGTAKVFEIVDPAFARAGLYNGPGDTAAYFTESARIAAGEDHANYTTKDAPPRYEVAKDQYDAAVRALKVGRESDLPTIEEDYKTAKAAFEQNKTPETTAALDRASTKLARAKDWIARQEYQVKNFEKVLDDYHTNKIAANTHVVALDIRNPMNMDAPLPRAEALRIAKVNGFELSDHFIDGMSGDDFYEILRNENPDAPLSLLKKAGYDGVTHLGEGTWGGGQSYQHRVWIPFDKSQVHYGKSWGVEGPKMTADRVHIGDFAEKMLHNFNALRTTSKAEFWNRTAGMQTRVVAEMIDQDIARVYSKEMTYEQFGKKYGIDTSGDASKYHDLVAAVSKLKDKGIQIERARVVVPDDTYGNKKLEESWKKQEIESRKRDGWTLADHTDDELFFEKYYYSETKIKENLDVRHERASNAIRGVKEFTQQSKTEALDQTYAELKSTYLAPNTRIENFTPTDPNWSFENLVKSYAKERGVDNNSYPAFREEMAKRLVADLRAALPEEDAKFLKAAEKSMLEQQKTRQAADAHTLTNIANNNGMYIDVEDAGRIVIRDLEFPHKELYRTNKFSDAQQFIDKSGQASGYVISDGGGDLPPIAPHLFDAPNASNEPLSFLRYGKAQRFVDALALWTPWATRNRALFLAMDNKFGMNVAVPVFDKLNEAMIRRNAAMKPHIEWLGKVSEDYRSVDKGRRSIVTGYIETMTPEEIIARGAANRTMTPFEIQVAKQIVGDGVDLIQVFKGRRMYADAELDFQKAVEKAPNKAVEAQLEEAYNAKLTEIREGLKLSDAEVRVINDFKGVDKMKKDDATIGMITRLARAMKGNEMSREEYIKHHNMTTKELALATKIEAKYRELAGVFGIEPEQMLNGFLTHARLYSADGREFISQLRDFGPSKAKDFYAEMARTGEIQNWELDPIIGLQRYIKAGYDAIHVNELVADAENHYKAEIENAVRAGNLGERGARQAEKIISTYISDLKGHADSARLFSADIVKKLNEEFGWKLKEDLMRNVVNTMSSTGEAAAQGARATAAIRDFAGGALVSNMRFGVEETGRILAAGAKAISSGEALKLQAEGMIPEGGIVHFADAVDYEASKATLARNKFTRTVDNTNQALFKLSGQKNIYQLLHAGHYIRAMERFGEAVKMLNENRIDREEFGRRIFLHKTDLPVAKEVMRLVDAGQQEEAAKFLARQTGQDMVGVYGFANHPSGWNSNIGRVAGQFGQWSAWFRETFLRETARGTLGDRSAAAFRLMAGQKIMVGIGASFGLNLTRWAPTQGILFGGGPSVGIYNAVSDALTGTGYQQEQGIGRLQRMLPHDINTMGQIYLPGSFFAQDLFKAAQLYNEGETGLAGARAMGIPVIKPTDNLFNIGGVPLGGVERRVLETGGAKPSKQRVPN